MPLKVTKFEKYCANVSGSGVQFVSPIRCDCGKLTWCVCVWCNICGLFSVHLGGKAMRKCTTSSEGWVGSSCLFPELKVRKIKILDVAKPGEFSG